MTESNEIGALRGSDSVRAVSPGADQLAASGMLAGNGPEPAEPADLYRFLFPVVIIHWSESYGPSQFPTDLRDVSISIIEFETLLERIFESEQDYGTGGYCKVSVSLQSRSGADYGPYRIDVDGSDRESIDLSRLLGLSACREFRRQQEPNRGGSSI